MHFQERQIVTSLVLLMLFLWLGFFWHRDTSFPGSLAGSMLGIAGAFFMLVPLWYLIIKRISFLKKWVTRAIPMPVLLKWHIYAGIAGPILGLLHSAHRFESPVGITLIIFMFVVVISGFIGRYLLSFISSSLREKQQLKAALYEHLQQASVALNHQGNSDFQPTMKNGQPSFQSPIEGLVSILPAVFRLSPHHKILKLVDAISDLEYSISIHDVAKRWFKKWLKLHIALSVTLYLVLIFHVTAEVYFGLRWL